MKFFAALAALTLSVNALAQEAAAPAAAPAADAPAGAPRIFSPEPVFDFGSQDNEGKVQHDFTVMNVGTGTLEISNVKSSCGCTVAELAKKSLAPGEETTVSATFNLSGKQGPQTKVISVSSNDPDAPVYKLELKGNAIATIEVEPRFINYGSSSSELLADQKITIKSNKPEVTFNVTGAEVSEPAFTAEVVTVEAGKSFEVILKNVQPLAPGIAQGVVNVRTDDPKRATIPVRYHATVVGDLDIAPNQINLRFSETGEVTQQYMRVAAGRVKTFKILSVEAPSPTMEAEVIPRGENNYNIRLGNMPTDMSLDGKELIIKTDLATNPDIKVPIKVIKLPAVDGTAALNPTRPKAPAVATPAAPAAPAAPAEAAAPAAQ
jgi:hypothetical protein